MRHVWSLIAGIVIAPLVWGLLALGQADSVATFAKWEQSETIFTGDLFEAAAYLAAAGVLLGLIATLRFSPLGPLVAGLLFLAPTVGVLIDPMSVRDAFPAETNLAGQKFSLFTPVVNGTGLVLSALLLVAVASVHRWRRWPSFEPAAVAEPTSPAPAVAEPVPAVPVSPPGLSAPVAPAVPAPREPVEAATSTERFEWIPPSAPTEPTQPMTVPPASAPVTSPPPPMFPDPGLPPLAPRHRATEEPTLPPPPPVTAPQPTPPPPPPPPPPTQQAPPPPPPPTWPPSENVDRDQPISDSPWAAPPRPPSRED